MAKKGKDEVPNPNSVANRDIIQRLNFLYQASELLGTLGAGLGNETKSTTGPAEVNTDNTRTKKKRRRQHTTSLLDLSRTYVRSMKSIGTKTNVRMDPAVKRTLCKGCNIVLVPGTTATVRVTSSKSHGHVVSYSCIACKSTRRVPAPPSPDSSVEAEGAQAAGAEEDMMADSGPSNVAAGVGKRHGKRVNGKHPPFFDVGHVVYRGNERLSS